MTGTLPECVTLTVPGVMPGMSGITTGNVMSRCAIAPLSGMSHAGVTAILVTGTCVPNIAINAITQNMGITIIATTAST